MKELSRRDMLLVALAFAAAVGAAWYFNSEPAEQADVVVAAARTGERSRNGTATPPPAPTQLALSTAVRLGPPQAGPTPTIFATKDWTPPPPPPPPPPPHAPPLPFVFMGSLAEEGGRTSYYLAQGDKALAVGDGEVINGTYRVEGMQGTQLALTYLPLSIRQTLNLPAGGGALAANLVSRPAPEPSPPGVAPGTQVPPPEPQPAPQPFFATPAGQQAGRAAEPAGALERRMRRSSSAPAGSAANPSAPAPGLGSVTFTPPPSFPSAPPAPPAAPAEVPPTPPPGDIQENPAAEMPQ